MSAVMRGNGARASRTPSLPAGLLAAVPLFCAYELGLRLDGEAVTRAAAEDVLTRSLSLLGPELQWARATALALAALVALAVLRRRAGPDAPPLRRELGLRIGQGVLAGALLLPLLTALQTWLAREPLATHLEPERSLASVLRLIGAAPWEELLFRVGCYGSLFLLVRQASTFLGLASPLARAAADLSALLGSALAFALFHLDAVQAHLGAVGEPYHRGLFLWRVSAGLVLGGLFRWRGLGVAAWAHAVFNLGVALGIGA
jgi:hypothetical protein